MTSHELIAEGRNLERPCIALRPNGNGPVAAVWYDFDEDEEPENAWRPWLTVDAKTVPGLISVGGDCMTLFTPADSSVGGGIEVANAWPERPGTRLYAHPISVLPPIDAVFAQGSAAVGEWIRSHGWERNDRYNSNFGDSKLVEEYERIWFQEYPFYRDDDTYAVLGGWHWPGPDRDWHDLIDEHLMILTVRDSEPWVEAWRTRSGDFKVIQRIT